MVEYVHYTTDEPTKAGIYACRIQDVHMGFMADKFLTWLEGNWWQGGTHQFRGKVYGWVGPLQRKLPNDISFHTNVS